MMVLWPSTESLMVHAPSSQPEPTTTLHVRADEAPVGERQVGLQAHAAAQVQVQVGLQAHMESVGASACACASGAAGTPMETDLQH
eukprot:1136317-Pelagomonas_calceolata.AAC.3